MNKFALVSIMGNVGTTFNSQGGGYGLIATKMMRDRYPTDQIDVNPDPATWHDYDHIFVCEGVNFVEGSFNVPGGPQQVHHDKMKAMGGYQGGVTFINQKFDFETFNKRIDIKYAEFPQGEVLSWIWIRLDCWSYSTRILEEKHSGATQRKVRRDCSLFWKYRFAIPSDETRRSCWRYC